RGRGLGLDFHPKPPTPRSLGSASPGAVVWEDSWRVRMEDVRNVADDSTVDQESRRRKRSVWEAWQKEALLKAFGKNPSPSFGARQDLARELGLPECRVRIWFQNRRCRTRQRFEEPGARAQGRRHAEERRTRLRTRLSSAQLKILLQAFERDPKPPYAAREQLARRTALPEDTIQIWFQNRRARCS
ncbi:double homeobox protein 4C-like, partial [Sigmodon hispidus]